jgi:site-specific recombinase
MPLGWVARAGVVALAALATVSACGITDYRGRDFCTQYSEVQQSADAVRQLDPQTASADDVRQAVEDLRRQVGQLQGTSDGNLNTQISNLRTAAADLRAAAVTASQEGYVAARPLLRVSVTDLKQSLAVFKASADAQCRPAG